MAKWRTQSIILSLACTSMAFSDSFLEERPKEQCTPDRKPTRITARHIESKGVGYNTGYTTVEGFFGSYKDNMTWLPFLDLRGHVFNDGKLAANAGFGIRGLMGCRIYGINAYYDYRDSKRSHYNQVSAGLETLGARWDFRINGYLPVGDKMSHPYQAKFKEFSGNNMLLSRKYQFAMKGADAELGIHFCKSRNFEFYAAAGPYYFRGPIGHNAWGGKARINGKWKDLIVAELSNTYDNVFHDNVQGQISFNWPLGPRPIVKKGSSHCFDNCKFIGSLSDRFIQPVVRSEIVVVDARRQTAIAKDPGTGKPFNFIFVDNTSHSAGTFESPYSSLATAEANSNTSDIIYVFPGDGTTNNMNMGITLQDSQRLLGSGTAQIIQTTAGTITVPALTSTMPVITNQTITNNGDVVVLGNNNIVSGMFIEHGVGGSSSISGHGISQPTSGSNGTFLNNTIDMVGNQQTDDAANGIDLTNVTGSVQIAGNRFNQNQQATVQGNVISININGTSLQNASYIIENNQAISDRGIDINLMDCSNWTFSISENNFNNDLINIDLIVDTTSQAFTNSMFVNNNYFITSSSANVALRLGENSNNSSPITNVSMENNTLISQGSGPRGSNTIALSGNSQTAVSVKDNYILSQGIPFNIAQDVASELTIDIANNTLISANGIISASYLSSKNFTANVTDNIITMTASIPVIKFQIPFTSTIIPGATSLTVSNNSITGGSMGIDYGTNGATNTLTITNNNFSNQFQNAISIDNVASSSIDISGNTFFGTLHEAVTVTNGTTTLGSNLCLSLINNTATPIQLLSPPNETTAVYSFTNSGGTFILDAERNIGLIETSGTTPGTCQ